MSAYRPKTGAKCGCRQGVERDNCPRCEGTGMVIDFKAIREKPQQPEEGAHFTPGPLETTYEPATKTWGVCLPDGGDVLAQLVEREADATLFAAAPAMYEALQIMVRAANVDEIDPLAMFASIERAKAALELAEGR